MRKARLPRKGQFMHFEVKAFKGAKRRFENLDNIDELNTFVHEWSEKGFTKFIIKSFDSDGFRTRRFYLATESRFLDKKPINS